MSRLIRQCVIWRTDLYLNAAIYTWSQCDEKNSLFQKKKEIFQQKGSVSFCVCVCVSSRLMSLLFEEAIQGL